MCRNMLRLPQGRVRLGVRERFCTQRWLGTELAPQGSDHSTELLEFRERLGCTLRHTAWFWGDPVWSQGLDSMVLVGPFQLRTFCGLYLTEQGLIKRSDVYYIVMLHASSERTGLSLQYIEQSVLVLVSLICETWSDAVLHFPAGFCHEVVERMTMVTASLEKHHKH